MIPEQIIKELEILADSFKLNEQDCIREMGWLKKRNFSMECEAMRYKQEAFARCWLDLWNVISKIKKNTTINKEKEDGKT